MVEYLLKNPVIELLYRFVLWAGFSFVLRALALLADEHGGGYFLKAIGEAPSGIYWNVLIGTGLFLLTLALFAKDLGIACAGVGVLRHIVNEIAVLIGRVSSDLILAAYGVSAFLIGWGVFALAQEYHAGNTEVIEQGLTLLGLMGAFTLFVGVLALIARAPAQSWLLAWWYWLPSVLRYALYLAAVAVIVVVFWLPPARQLT